jgi:hypothetical protein
VSAASILAYAAVAPSTADSNAECARDNDLGDDAMRIRGSDGRHRLDRVHALSLAQDPHLTNQHNLQVSAIQDVTILTDESREADTL